MTVLVLTIFAVACIAGLATAMAANQRGLTAAAAVGSALSGSPMRLMLDQELARPSQFDEWVIAIVDQDRLAGRAVE